MSTTITVNHLARVEGHGGVTVELDGDSVREVRFDIFEGPRLLETLAHGKSYRDISQFLSRICAICSVAHALTSIKATEAAFGVRPSAQTELLRDLLYRGESIESHALHIFLLAVPDYLGYSGAIAMAAEKPEAVLLGLRLKKLGNTIQEIIGGRAVHPVNAVPGGFGKLPEMDDLIALRRDLLRAVADFDTVISLIASLPPAGFCRAKTQFVAMRNPDEYGYYAGSEFVVAENSRRQAFPAAEYRKFAGETSIAHSHAKHSFHDGRPFMVGSLARLTVNGEKLDGRAAEARERLGLRPPFTNPMDNNKGQAVELIFDIEYALRIVDRLLAEGIRPEVPVPVEPVAGAGTALTEAPRGLLVHSYEYDGDGRVTYADVITPTAFNAASVEEHIRRAVEQSDNKEAAALTRKCEMIVRAYDPCISCSVHVMQMGHAL
ncbi:MAG: Ni/Fe hydrogenase subunit alpha [Bryobacteraceae bacterium]